MALLPSAETTKAMLPDSREVFTNARMSLSPDPSVQTTAKNQDIFEGGLHISLDQSGTGIEGDFQGGKIDTLSIIHKKDDIII